jgi:hypothetical protein
LRLNRQEARSSLAEFLAARLAGLRCVAWSAEGPALARRAGVEGEKYSGGWRSEILAFCRRKIKVGRCVAGVAS